MRKEPPSEILPAGTVLRVSRSGEIVSLSSTPVDAVAGTEVFDARGREVGRVTALIGKVGSPYLIARPEKGVDARRLIGTSIYLMKRDRKCQNRR
jgi:rRNA processing protein Gar1